MVRILTVRMTDENYALLMRASDGTGRTASDIVRNRVIGHVREIVAELDAEDEAACEVLTPRMLAMAKALDLRPSIYLEAVRETQN